MCGKENDELRIAEENEELQNDCNNSEKFRNKAMEYIKRDYIRNLEVLQQAYIQENMDMCVYDMNTANSVFEFLRRMA
jgi:hypothetical protein